MHKYIIRWVLPLFFMVFCSVAFGQQNTPPVEMADTMRSNGKIFVVVAVIVTLFTGIILYLIALDRKISRLEKESGKS
jgi:ABC-type spermidine/putrescine transport system permease subunit II